MFRRKITKATSDIIKLTDITKHSKTYRALDVIKNIANKAGENKNNIISETSVGKIGSKDTLKSIDGCITTARERMFGADSFLAKSVAETKASIKELPEKAASEKSPLVEAVSERNAFTKGTVISFMENVRPLEHLMPFYYERAPRVWDWVKKKHGYPADFDYQAALRQHERELVKNAEVCMRIHTSDLITVLKSVSGEFLSRFNTQKSYSQDSLETRAMVERGLFGYHGVVYGYLSDHPDGSLDDESAVDLHGFVILRYRRKKVEKSVSFIMEDSINLSDGKKELYAIPSLLVNPNGCSFPLKVMYRNESRQAGVFAYRNDDPIKDYPSIQNIFPYPEAHIHERKAKAENLLDAIFTFPRGKMVDEAKELLKHWGISYRDRKKTLRERWFGF